MSSLTIWDEKTKKEEFNSTHFGEIKWNLEQLGVKFDRWDGVIIDDDYTADQILEAYSPYLEELLSTGTVESADVVSMTVDTPNYQEMRSKFLNEHTHSEDEVRMFVRGYGDFILHIDDKIYSIHCEKDDLLSVPKNIKHWFDAGTEPNFTALRIFNDPSGWVAQFTGSDIATQFPPN
jgi:1,2-dihydroxy-3-keto-5-methylthiopentene dioxygenase